MLSKKEICSNGKKAFYRNWKSCIIICFLYTVFIGGTIITVQSRVDFDKPTKIVSINTIEGDTNSEIVNEFLYEIRGNKKEEEPFVKNATKGVLGSIANNISSSGSYLFGVLNAINQALFKDRIWASVVIIIGALLSLIYWIFVSKVLEVGRARFFLENRRFTKTRPQKILLPFRINKTTHIAYTMFIKNIYTILWSFTIVGPFIKHYSYSMVPYILAENPNMTTRDVIRLSKEMMNGHKWEMFLLDISFIPYYLLGVLTFNIGNLVFTDPYMNATKAELYMDLRELSKTRGIINSNLLKDKELDGKIIDEEYPAYEFMLKEARHHYLLSYDYKRNYSILDLILLFFIFSFIGWIWEVLIHLFQYGDFVNRGALYGPWLPIYGAGCITLLIILKPFRKNPFLYCVLAMIVCGLIEYGTSVYLEIVHHMAWWDYTGFFLNINGRVCLEGLLLFGVGGTFVTYVVAPFLANILDKMKKEPKIYICILLVGIITFDFYLSGKKPNSGEGVTSEITDSKLDKQKSNLQ